MQTTATPTAGAAAPAKLPVYSVANFTEADELKVTATAARVSDLVGPVPALVGLFADAGNLRFQHSMTPAQARELAVYLVDCANALDNPAERVIVDDTPEPAVAGYPSGECAHG